jgi:hypothetical protein
MPIWLRKFTYQQISECKKRESEGSKKKSSKPGNTQIDLVNPDKSSLPDYAQNTQRSTFNTKTSKK